MHSVVVSERVSFPAGSRDPLLALYARAMAALSANFVAVWTAVAVAVAIAYVYSSVWKPYAERQAVRRAEAERAQLAKVVRDDATRLAAVQELQQRAHADAVEAEAARRAHELEKRLRKLELNPDTVAGHKLGDASSSSSSSMAPTASTAPTASKPKPKKPSAPLRPLYSMGGGGGGSSSYRPSGAMRKAGGGGGG